MEQEVEPWDGDEVVDRRGLRQTAVVIASVVCILLVIAVVVSPPYGYYQILRWAILTGNIAMCVVALRTPLVNDLFAAPLALMAILHLTLRLPRNQWQVLNIVEGGLLIWVAWGVWQGSFAANWEVEDENYRAAELRETITTNVPALRVGLGLLGVTLLMSLGAAQVLFSAPPIRAESRDVDYAYQHLSCTQEMESQVLSLAEQVEQALVPLPDQYTEDGPVYDTLATKKSVGEKEPEIRKSVEALCLRAEQWIAKLQSSDISQAQALARTSLVKELTPIPTRARELLKTLASAEASAAFASLETDSRSIGPEYWPPPGGHVDPTVPKKVNDSLPQPGPSSYWDYFASFALFSLFSPLLYGAILVSFGMFIIGPFTETEGVGRLFCAVSAIIVGGLCVFGGFNLAFGTLASLVIGNTGLQYRAIAGIILFALSVLLALTFHFSQAFYQEDGVEQNHNLIGVYAVPACLIVSGVAAYSVYGGWIPYIG